MTFNLNKSVNQDISGSLVQDIELVVKREDLIHPFISGNKYRKLKYNLEDALSKDHSALMTFGGAYSNHIAAVASAGKESGLQTIGIIRGDELVDRIKDNPTLRFAQDCGMDLHFVTRERYRNKSSESFLEELRSKLGEFYLIPEGGTNQLAVNGCEEILTEDDLVFDIICCPVGTGGTISGLINSTKDHQSVLGFSALKGDLLKDNIRKFTNRNNWELINRYHFGGFAKINEELVTFINQFKHINGIQLDPIYTGKMMYGIMQMIKEGHFSIGTRILAIHTGGLQGIAGMNKLLKRKHLTLIE